MDGERRTTFSLAVDIGPSIPSTLDALISDVRSVEASVKAAKEAIETRPRSIIRTPATPSSPGVLTEDVNSKLTALINVSEQVAQTVKRIKTDLSYSHIIDNQVAAGVVARSSAEIKEEIDDSEGRTSADLSSHFEETWVPRANEDALHYDLVLKET